jgi:hypothetical protein
MGQALIEMGTKRRCSGQVLERGGDVTRCGAAGELPEA